MLKNRQNISEKKFQQKKTPAVNPISKFEKQYTNAISLDEAFMDLPRRSFFFQTLITVVGKLLLLIVFELRLRDCT